MSSFSIFDFRFSILVSGRAGLLLIACLLGGVGYSQAPKDEAALEALALKWKPLSPAHTPDPKQFRLELLTPLGGWMLEAPRQVEVRLVDPTDPKPARPAWRAQAWDGDSSGEEEVPWHRQTPEQRKIREAWWELERRRNQWRENRKVEVWFNGRKTVENVTVGQGFWVQIRAADGENRLEVGYRPSGSWQLRSWWTWASRSRLQVRVLEAHDSTPAEDGREEDYDGAPGVIRVVEPDGTVADQTNTPSGGRKTWHAYTHPDPLPGTYTVRWKPQAYGDEDGPVQGKPRRVAVEVLLDGGTDKERRWRFEQLVMPGRSDVVLGAFDVED